MENDMTYDKKKMRKYVLRLILRILRVAAVLELLALILYSFAAYFTGFTFIFNTTYGWPAVWDTFLIYGMILSPLHLASIGILTGFSIYFKKTRGKYDPEEEKRYLKRIGKALILPGIIVAALVLLILLADYVIEGTMTGAKLMVRLGYGEKAPNVYRAAAYTEYEDVFIVEKNGETVYLKGKEGDLSDLEFLNDLYYIKYFYSETPEEELPDMTGADRYLFMDRDGIYIGMYTVKGDDLLYSEMIGDPYEEDYYGDFVRYLVRVKEQ